MPVRFRHGGNLKESRFASSVAGKPRGSAKHDVPRLAAERPELRDFRDPLRELVVRLTTA